MRRFVFAVLVLAAVLTSAYLPWARAIAIESPEGDSSAAATPPDPVVVVTRDGIEHEGRLYRIAADTIQVYSLRDGVVFLNPAEVMVVHPTHPATFKGALLGATFGLAATFILEYVSHDPPIFQWDKTVYIAIGSIGMFVGGSVGYKQRYCDYRHDIWDKWQTDHSIHVSVVF